MYHTLTITIKLTIFYLVKGSEKKCYALALIQLDNLCSHIVYAYLFFSVHVFFSRFRT